MKRLIVLNAVGDYYVIVIALVLLAGVLGGQAAYSAYTETDTVTEQRVVSTATTFSNFDHSASVQEDVGVFSRGIDLENRSLYFTTVSPDLDGEYSVRHGGRSQAPAKARIQVRELIRSVGDGGRVYWKQSEPVASANATSLDAGEPLTANFSMNVSRSLDVIQRVRENLSASPGATQILLRVDAVVEKPVGDERFVDTRSETMQIDPGRGTYTVSATTEGRKLYEAKERIVRELPPSPINLYGGVGLFVLSLLSATVLERKRREGIFSVTEAELQEARFHRERDKFEEWISEGRVETDADRQRIMVPTLTDIVDVAVDTDSRVLETEPMTRYVVLTDGSEYVFDRRDGAEA